MYLSIRAVEHAHLHKVDDLRLFLKVSVQILDLGFIIYQRNSISMKQKVNIRKLKHQLLIRQSQITELKDKFRLRKKNIFVMKIMLACTLTP